MLASEMVQGQAGLGVLGRQESRIGTEKCPWKKLGALMGGTQGRGGERWCVEELDVVGMWLEALAGGTGNVFGKSGLGDRVIPRWGR